MGIIKHKPTNVVNACEKLCSKPSRLIRNYSSQFCMESKALLFHVTAGKMKKGFHDPRAGFTPQYTPQPHMSHGCISGSMHAV